MKEYTAEGKFIQQPTSSTGTGTSVTVGLKQNSRPDTKNAKGQGKSSKRALMH
jgi:hypothetical protein